jgi:hypothetical protein
LGKSARALRVEMKDKIKALLQQYAAPLLEEYQARSNRRMFRQQFAQQTDEACRLLFASGKPEVLTGPFQGLKYINETVWGPIMPKWLGSYESELHHVVTEIARFPYKAVIDVGCAEGYYAVGLATVMRDVPVYAFDTDPISRRQAARLGTLNGVLPQLHIDRWCDDSSIKRISAKAQGKLLLICDIEGFETQLLRPEKCESLLQTDILVEIHDDPGSSVVSNEICKRFTKTHDIRVIHHQSRENWVNTHLSSEVFASVPAGQLRKMAEENRVRGRTWFWMTCSKRAAALSPKS